MAVTVAELQAVLRAEVAPFLKGMQDSQKELAGLRKQVEVTSAALTRDITKSTADASRELARLDGMAHRFTATLKGLSGPDVLNNVAAGAKNAANGFGLMQSSWVRFAVLFAGGNLIASSIQQIAMALRQGIAELTRWGFEAQRAEESFARTTEMIGINGQALVDGLRAASKGIVDESDILLASSKALAQGLNPESLVKLMEVAVARATLAGTSIVEAFNNITTAVTTQQVRALKTMGIVIDLARVYDAYAQKIGTVVSALTEEARSQALADEVIAKSARTHKALTDGVLTNAQQVERAQAVWHNFGESVGKVFATASGNFQKNSADMLIWFQETGAWLDELGVKWNNYWLKKSQSLGLPTGNARMKISPQQQAAQDSLAAALGQVGTGETSGTKAVQQILDIEHALGMQAQAMKVLSSQQATGAVSAAQYAAGLATQLLALKALKDPTQDVRDKILELQAAVAGANFTVLQQGLTKSLQAAQALESGLLISVKESVAQRNTTVEQGAVVEAQIRVSALAQQRMLLAQGLAAFQGTEAQKLQLQQQLGALSIQFDQAKSAERLALWAKENAALAVFIALLNSDIDTKLQRVTEGIDHEARALREAAEMQATFAAGMSVLMGELDGSADAFDSLAAAARGDLVTSLTSAEKELRALKETLGQTGPEAEVLREFLAKTGLTVTDLDERTKNFLLTLGETRAELANTKGAEAYRQSLTAIGIEAQLFGDRFDLVGARVSALEGRLRDMARTSRGEVTPAMRELAVELEGLRQFQDTKDLFADMFGSVTGGIAKMIEGLQLGTRKWKDMGTMALDVLRSIAAEVVNRLINRALNPLIDKLATVVAAGLSGGTSPSAQRAVSDALGPEASAVAASTGSGGFSFSNIPSGLLDPGLWSSLSSVATGLWGAAGGAGGALGPAFTGITSADMLLSGASLSEVSSAATSAAGAASTLTVALAGVGAAVAVFGTIMDFVNGNIEAGIGGLVGGVLGAVAGGIIGSIVPGIGTVLGALAGGAIGDLLGSWIGGLFGGPSNFDLKRIAAADEANQALGSVAGGYQSALNTGDPAAILAALSAGGGGGASNSVRTELVLPSNLAAQIGLTGQQIGDQVVTQWKDVTLAQFQQVLAAFKENPTLLQNLRGSGDVPYLAQGDAEAVAEQIRQGAIALLTAFQAMETVRDKISQLGVDLTEAATKVLPPDLATRFAEGIIDPITDRMKAVLTSGLPVEEMQSQMDALGKELEAYVGLLGLYGQVTQDIAALSGDMVTLTKGAVLGIEGILAAADKAVTDAQARAKAAVGPEEILKSEIALREAVLKRYATTIELEKQIQANIAAVLSAASTTVQMLTRVAQWEITSRGSVDTIASLLAHLAGAAGIELKTGRLREPRVDPDTVRPHGDPTQPFTPVPKINTKVDATQLWAVQQALAAIIATLPAVIQQFGVLQTSAEWLDTSVKDIVTFRTKTVEELHALVGQITDTVLAAAKPFLDVQQTAIDQATGPAKFQLLQQQAANWIALADAAIAGINQWAQAAITGATEATATLIAGLAAQRDAQLAAIDAQITGIREAEVLAQESRRAEIDALSEQLAKSREFEAAIEGMGKFLAGLQQGPLGPGNTAAKATMAQDAFAKALQAYNANPTAGGLTDLSALAQTMLSLKETVLSKPNPVFQALSATTIKQLEAAQALAKAQVSDSAILQSQLDALIAADKTAVKFAADAIAGLEAQKVSITKDFETQTAALEAALELQITAIEDAAKKEIKEINDALGGALKNNAFQQAALINQQIAHEKKLADAVGDTTKFQTDTVAILNAILLAMGASLPAPTRPTPTNDDIINRAIPAANGMERVTEGLYHLHDNEAVLPKNLADDWRAGRGRAGIRSAATGAGLETDVTNRVLNDTGPGGAWAGFRPGFAWGGPNAAAMNALEQQVFLLTENLKADLSRNTSWGPGHKMRVKYDADEIAAMRSKLAAQIDAIRAQQRTIMASIPKTPPPGTPPTTPPPAPPYVPPSPPWLSRDTGQLGTGERRTTIVIKLDGKTIGEATLPTVRDDARGGDLHTIIVDATS